MSRAPAGTNVELGGGPLADNIVGTNDEVAAHIRRVAAGRNIAFVAGNFNIVHPGHLRLLRFAADCADFLVVGVCDQSTEGVVLPEELRLDGVKSIGLVDFAFLMRSRSEDFITVLRPDIVIKGKEHEARFNPEQRAVETYGGKLIFGSGDVVFSSLDLLRQEFQELNHSTILKPYDYLERHQLTHQHLREVLSRFSDLKVTVVGDLIVDEYITCDPIGMSQEDPTIVVAPVQNDLFIGGSAIVAAHARLLGANVNYFTVTGNDESARFARTRLAEYGVKAQFLVDESRRTTLKQRFRAGTKSLLRVNHLRQHAIDQRLADGLYEGLTASLEGSDVVIFSDFNYGCLPQRLVEQIVGYCAKREIPMLADSQSSSQLGDISRFRGMLLVTPTEREARLAVRDQESGLIVLAEALRQRSSAQNIFITLGAEGLLIYANDPKTDEKSTDRLSAMNRAPRDVAGAGDSLLACAGLALASGADIWSAAYLGSIAAACQVSRTGNTPLAAKEIEAELDLGH